jgi:hypothetical protein
MLRTMLRCEECRCVSDTGKGWLAFIAEDPDDEATGGSDVLPALC